MRRRGLPHSRLVSECRCTRDVCFQMSLLVSRLRGLWQKNTRKMVGYDTGTGSKKQVLRQRAPAVAGRLCALTGWAKYVF